MGDETNTLLKSARKISNNPSKREIDMLLSTGEQKSIALLSIALNDLNIKTKSLNANQCGIETDRNFSNAKIKKINSTKIKSIFEKYQVLVIAGFQGVCFKGLDITTLGRGGSDTTAVALASCLNLKKCEINTDVKGVFSVDPNLYKDAKLVNSLSYKEMLEFSEAGANVLHKRAINLALKNNIKLVVKSTFNEKFKTIIKGEGMEESKIKGIGVNNTVVKIKLNNLPIEKEVFKDISVKCISNDIFINHLYTTKSKDTKDICVLVTFEDFEEVYNCFINYANKFDKSFVCFEKDVSLISLIGNGIIKQKEILQNFYNVTDDLNIDYENIKFSELNIKYVVKDNLVKKHVKTLHEKLIK